MRCSECGCELEPQMTECPNCGGRHSMDPDSHFKAAMDFVADGNLEGAIELLEHCLNADPEHLTGRFNLGVALCLADKCDEAIGHLYYVLTKEPDYPGIYTALGEAAFGSYLYHEEQASMKSMAMIHLLKQAIDQDEEDVDAYFTLGNAFLALGLAEEALPALKSALRLDPQSPAIFYLIAKSYRELGRLREARMMAERALDLAQPDNQFLDDIESLVTELQEEALAL